MIPLGKTLWVRQFGYRNTSQRIISVQERGCEKAGQTNNIALIDRNRGPRIQGCPEKNEKLHSNSITRQHQENLKIHRNLDIQPETGMIEA
jgi:hypothetical protein